MLTGVLQPFYRFPACVDGRRSCGVDGELGVWGQSAVGSNRGPLESSLIHFPLQPAGGGSLGEPEPDFQRREPFLQLRKQLNEHANSQTQLTMRPTQYMRSGGGEQVGKYGK